MTDQRTSIGRVVVHVFGRTDVGRTREHNEDAFLIADLTKNHTALDDRLEEHVVGDRGTLFMVADGMGGAAAGEIASAMAVETVIEEVRARWLANDRRDPESFAAALKIATDVANTRIHRMATEQPEFRGMGTTATIAGLLGDTLYLAQVGDSRAYVVRDGKARQITKDQSLMQRLARSPRRRLSRASAATSFCRRSVRSRPSAPISRISSSDVATRWSSAATVCRASFVRRRSRAW